MAAFFTAVAAENTDETAVTKTAATSVKFSSHRGKMFFSAGMECATFAWDVRKYII